MLVNCWLSKGFWKSLMSSTGHVGIRYLELPLCHIHFSLSPPRIHLNSGDDGAFLSYLTEGWTDKNNKPMFKIITNIWKNISVLLPSFLLVLQILKMFQFIKMTSLSLRLHLKITTIWLTRNSQGWDFQILLKAIFACKLIIQFTFV